MDRINEFLKNTLPRDFQFADDLVMDKLNACIELLAIRKFGASSLHLIDDIPASELPRVPFGQFKRVNKQEILAQLAAKAQEARGQVDIMSRDKQMEKMAQVRRMQKSRQ